MADAIIPEAVAAFIALHIDSVVQLEVLLLLHRNSPMEFTVEDVAHALQIDPSWVAPRLALLCATEMLVSSGGSVPCYRFDPKAAELKKTIAQLATVYASHRVRVTSLIFAKPLDALRSFAEAFRIRKDRPDG